MLCLVQFGRNQLRMKSSPSLPLSSLMNSHPNHSNRTLNLDQIRFKTSSRQTGGGKTKGKTSENRTAQAKGYLKKANGASSGMDGKTDRFEVIRQMLYEGDAKMDDSARLARLQKAVPEFGMHETIDRAWKLNERHLREKHEEELEKQYQSMNKALEELRTTDIKLYLKVIKDENGSIQRLQNIVQINPSNQINLNSTGKLFGLFPRQIKLPTESLPNPDKVWDHDWKNPTNPLI
ncbi:hypothetical protein MJO29_004028 [Puccinia striiformis f. sp. tritici]|uniref:Large ribosomal subunit protein mL40 n=2 Tax=Puccinia striiformis f. sp. tritici TaxID=168172 RepID=A0A0L0V412_9BASI|nr:hypothetical protein Pst134EA_007143 [Puccinia striiformis f. sp. tritici]KAI9608538.1 hypothetical protein H4Q26_004721 [Puccinia striiformis f. sp. tritici PST-130]KNE94030.1 hypothetical protein PSTG_12606 [Puccinia striiformis f. sp. tritici PST-78]KAH9460074.1 hypothetical protein Pst134EB_008279 [Puccinia striiformis f. sp. tritici]KAH9469867.1 hypothetical protein Pst134EA_007143 [Puccinia striiformis f. sp. tritici]KAI7963601.1 hypothetical protein MJO29_004028 [Puccinia striiformis